MQLERMERLHKRLARLRYPLGIGGGLVLAFAGIAYLGEGHGMRIGLNARSSYGMVIFVWPLTSGLLLLVTTIALVWLEARIDARRRALPKADVRRR